MMREILSDLNKIQSNLDDIKEFNRLEREKINSDLNKIYDFFYYYIFIIENFFINLLKKLTRK